MQVLGKTTRSKPPTQPKITSPTTFLYLPRELHQTILIQSHSINMRNHGSKIWLNIESRNTKDWAEELKEVHSSLELAA